MTKGIPVRQLEYISSTEVHCYVSAYDIKSVKKLARSLYKITVIKNAGLEYKIKSFFKNPMRLIGVILVCGLVIYQSLFVKNIEVNGYKAIPESELLQVLEESGIDDGTFIPGIKWDEAKDEIYNVFPQVTWIQLVRDGRKVILNIAEGTMPGEVETAKDEDDIRNYLVSETAHRYYCNIIASEAGYVENISNHRGLALVEKGDFVEKGQVLILGCVPIQATVYEEDYPTEYFVKAKGEVWATVPYRLQFNQERYIFSAGEKENLIVNKREKNKKEVQQKVEQQIRLWAEENLPEKAEITNKDLKFSYKENIIEIGVTIEVHQQIGEEQEITIGQKNSDRSGN